MQLNSILKLKQTKINRKQGTVALWSNSSCIRSGGWWFESRRCLISFDAKTCEAKQREEGRKLDPFELSRLSTRMYSCRVRVGTKKRRKKEFDASISCGAILQYWLILTLLN